MIISIKGGQDRSGVAWSKYVKYGTRRKPRDPEKVEIIDGDTDIGDLICSNSKYKQSYYSIVLAAKGKHSREKMQKIYDDWKRQFFIGLDEDEYHVDAVLHQDTDDSHIHVRVPTTHLTQDKHLQLYYDRKDRGRMTALQDFIALKYGLEIAREVGREIREEQTLEDIEQKLDKWREAEGREPVKLEKAKDRKKIEKEINQYIMALEAEGVLVNREQIEQKLKELGLNVERFGSDYQKDFSYVTVSNETGKMRIKGDIYGDEYWQEREKTHEEQQEQARGKQTTRNADLRREKVRARLNALNERRYQECRRLFGEDGVREAEHVEQVARDEAMSEEELNAKIEAQKAKEEHEKNMKKINNFVRGAQNIQNAASNPVNNLKQMIGAFNNHNVTDAAMQVSSIGLLQSIGKIFENEEPEQEAELREAKKRKKEKIEELETSQDEEEQKQEQEEQKNKPKIRRQKK